MGRTLPNLPDPLIDWELYGGYDPLDGQPDPEEGPEWIQGLMEAPEASTQQTAR